MSPVDKALWARNAFSDLPDTLSSWDKCMAKSYCKWPVIVAIIVVAVIIIAILACIINCLCCGIQCCRGCCSCLSCCCPSPRNKRSRKKYMDEPSPYHQPPPMPVNNAYQSPAPPGPPTYRGAQIARFDAPSSPAPTKTTNDDALPEMPTWDNARTKRVENNASPLPMEDMEMEPLNPVAQDSRRAPSAPRSNTGFMGPPPARVGTASSHYPESRPYDDQSLYARRSPGPGSPRAAGPPASPYDEPYGDYPYGMSATPGPYTPQQYTPMPSALSPAPAAYTSQPYIPMPSAVSPAGEAPRNMPYRQPSPGIGVGVPYRQPSPGPGLPYRQPSPGIGVGVPYRQPSPGPGLPFRQPSPGFSTQPPSYRGMSPAITSPTSPPPPFSASSPGPLLESNNDPGRPPSLLQSGRKPVPNSYRDL